MDTTAYAAHVSLHFHKREEAPEYLGAVINPKITQLLANYTNLTQLCMAATTKT